MKRFLCNVLVLLVLSLFCVNIVACNSASQSSTVDPINISLSINSLELKVGDTYQLYTTISPSTANQTVVYTSTNSNCATVNSQGEITAIGKGHTVIQVETINGLIATCNIEVYIATGEVSGCMMYQNGYGSTPLADSGATVQLIPTDIKSFPDDYYPSISYDYEKYGIYTTKTDSLGNYNFDNIPIGEYIIIVISKNAKWGLSKQIEYLQNIDSYIDTLYGENIGALVKTTSEKSYLTILLGTNYSTCSTFTVKENGKTNKSFTYVDYSKATL